VLNVKNSLVEKLRNVRVVKPIDDLLPAPLADDQPEVAQ